MINKLLYKLSGRLPCRLINRLPYQLTNHEESLPYLERYYVGELFGVTFYLHRFVADAEERHLHNHPWTWSRAAVLTGSYIEEVATDICPFATPAGGSGCITETRKIRWWNKINGNHFHKIVKTEPGTWTLFFHGARQRVKVGQCSKLKGWGFLENFCGAGGQVVTVFRPFPVSSREWWLTAPKGAEAGRVTQYPN